MLNTLFSSLKATESFKGFNVILQHIDSLEKSALDVFTESPEAKNKAIDAICGILQSLKKPIA